MSRLGSTSVERAGAFSRAAQALALMGAVILCGGAGLWALGDGRWTLGEAMYMALISASTVGYAELPGLSEVPYARGVTSVIIILGVGTFAYFQSMLTAIIVDNVIGRVMRRSTMRQKIKRLRKHVVVAGIGSTGRHVVEELQSTSTPFVVIDSSMERLQKVNEELMGGSMLMVHGDATEDQSLLDAGVERAMGVVAALTHDKDNLFVTLSARSLNPTARIVSKVVAPEADAKMLRAGANATVAPNIIGGRRLASELLRPEVVEFLDQMLRNKDRNLRLEEIDIVDECGFVGDRLRDVPLRKHTNVLVVAVSRRGEFLYNPGPDFILQSGDILVVLGETGEIQKAREIVREISPVSRRLRT